MKYTTTEDVKYLQKFVDLAVSQSIAHNQRLNKDRKQSYPKFEGVYQTIYECMCKLMSLLICISLLKSRIANVIAI
jgi:hypothetical protein